LVGVSESKLVSVKSLLAIATHLKMLKKTRHIFKKIVFYESNNSSE